MEKETLYAIYNKNGDRMYQYPASPYYEAMSRYLLPAKDIYPEAGFHIRPVPDNEQLV